MSEEGNVDEVPMPVTARLLGIGLASILYGSDNPEDTVTVALTKQELAAISTALFLLNRVAREVSPVAVKLSQKLMELSEAQGFLDMDDWQKHS